MRTRGGGASCRTVLQVAAIGILLASAAGADWPQFRGPQRDGLAADTSIAPAWPPQGPPVRWRRVAGGGFSGMAVTGGRVFTAWETSGRELAVALDAATGEILWTRDLGRSFENERGGGPRATPTVAGGAVFVLSASGHLAKLDAASGEPRWSRDLVGELGAPIPIWGISASPLLVDDRVVVQVGGENRALAAFSRDDGSLVWTAFSDAPSYSSPILAELAGVRQIVAVTGQNVVAVSPAGEVLWSRPWPVVNDIHVATPLVLPGDRLFVSSSYDVGAALLEIVRGDGGLRVDEVWRNRVMQNHFQTSIFHDGHLYGFDNAILTAIDAATAAIAWRTRGFGKGFLVAAAGRLVVLGERGRLALVEATPEAYRETGAVRLLEGRCWTPPSLADGVLYVRNEREILAVDLRPVAPEVAP